MPTPDEEEDDHRDEVEDADALVVGGGEPGHQALAGARVHEVARLAVAASDRSCALLVRVLGGRGRG